MYSSDYAIRWTSQYIPPKLEFIHKQNSFRIGGEITYKYITGHDIEKGMCLGMEDLLRRSVEDLALLEDTERI
jgi:hypothetical protein